MRTLQWVKALSRVVFVAALFTTKFPARAHGQGAGAQVGQTRPAKPAWLERAGKELRIKLGGAIRDETGAPAKDCKLTVTLKSQFARTNLPVVLRLARWLDDQKTLLSLDYVFLKIDDWRDLHGAEVADRLTGHERQGIPFCAIFDPTEKMLITSESPLGNIGHPEGFEGKRHIRKMLLATRSKLTDQQIDAIVNSLSD
jgi:hypothetical protein